ncbi:MAG: PHP domain-containing protein [Clostridia bacterium]|nr:PHP domain-containing protein [Clostridia bacterium]
MYLYETHLHTTPVSRCAGATPEESVRHYKDIGYAGIFITNHFIDGNINVDRALSYEERIEFYFSDYEKGAAYGREIGLDVFPGVEMTYGGTDFLVYGLDKAWYLAHPEIEGMPKSKLLPMLIEHGALVIHAHPFREASYIDHIRLYPRCVHGVEIFNACRSEFENKLAAQYTENYELIRHAGSDNHSASRLKTLGGMMTDHRIVDVADYVSTILSGGGKPFKRCEDGTIEML